MVEKHLTDVNLGATLLVILFGLWGGFLHFVSFIKEHNTMSISKKIVVLIIDLVSNTSLSILVFLALQGYNINEVLSVAIAGFIGHQGTNGVLLLLQVFLNKKDITHKHLDEVLNTKIKDI